MLDLLALIRSLWLLGFKNLKSEEAVPLFNQEAKSQKFYDMDNASDAYNLYELFQSNIKEFIAKVGSVLLASQKIKYVVSILFIFKFA